MQPIVFWIAGLSGLTFAAYGWDKAQARRDGRRIPERTLHLLSLAGGFAGGWVGMYVFHHKRRKPAFTLVLAAGTVLWIGLVAWRLT